MICKNIEKGLSPSMPKLYQVPRVEGGMGRGSGGRNYDFFFPAHLFSVTFMQMTSLVVLKIENERRLLPVPLAICLIDRSSVEIQ